MTLSENLARITLGKMQNPVRGFLHGTAAIASVVGTGFLLARASSWPARIAVIVFGAGLLSLYSTSSLYHSIPWHKKWKLRMQRLDHSMIFVLIAATYTPVGILVLDGSWRWIAMVIAWGIALVGVLHRVFSSMEHHGFAFGLMVLLGWLSVPIMFPLARHDGAAAVILMAVGGLLYTIGMIFKVTHWPRLWPRVFSSHELFHVLVVAASVAQWTATYRYIVPTG